MQDEQAKILAQREQTIAALREEAAVRANERERQPRLDAAAGAQAAIDQRTGALNAPLPEDQQGAPAPARALTTQQQGEIWRDEYLKQGLPAEAKEAGAAFAPKMHALSPGQVLVDERNPSAPVANNFEGLDRKTDQMLAGIEARLEGKTEIKVLEAELRAARLPQQQRTAMMVS